MTGDRAPRGLDYDLTRARVTEETTMTKMKWSELEGRGVITADGREIGEISDVVLDHEGWAVEAVVLKLERELLEVFQLKRPMFGTQTIQVPTSSVSSVGDKVLLNKKLDELSPEQASGAAAAVDTDDKDNDDDDADDK